MSKKGKVHPGFNNAAREGVLTAEEERVLRMRGGLIVSGDEPIGHRDLSLRAATVAGPTLAQIEAQALLQAKMYRDPEGSADEVVTAAIGERLHGIPMDHRDVN